MQSISVAPSVALVRQPKAFGGGAEVSVRCRDDIWIVPLAKQHVPDTI